MLESRSLFDLIVLDLVTEQLELKSPLEACASFNEARSFFFLFRAVGTRGRVTMYRFSHRMVRIQAQLAMPDAPALTMIPVSVHWGRANEKHGSLSRRMVSERWRETKGLRHFLGLLFTRKDILLSFEPGIDWQAETDAQQTVARNLRHIARLLRTVFRRGRVVSLGPALIARKEVINQLAEIGPSDEKSTKTRRQQAKRLVANLSYPSMRVLKAALDFFWSGAYDEVKLLHVERVRDLAKTHTIVYVPNHRSHIDYLILSYLLFIEGLAIPHIAAGDNMNLPVIGGLLRRCGAFFMRRSFRDDPSYGRLLANYVDMLLNEGHCLEIFIEGTRSRTGWMLEPRIGLLQTIMAFQARSTNRNIAFVPVFISYERLIESDSYQRELLGASKREERLRDAFNGASMAVHRRKFGSIRVALGQPIDARVAVAKEALSSSMVQKLGSHALESINASAILSSTNLIAMALFGFKSSMIGTNELATRINFLLSLLRVESLKHNYVVDEKPAMDMVRHIERLQFIEIHEERIEISQLTLARLAWFRNNTLHTLATPSLVAIVILNQDAGISRLDVIRQVAGLLPHVAAMLKFRMDLRETKRWLTHFKNAQLITEKDQHIIEAVAEQRSPNSEMHGLVNLIMPLLESMYATTSILLAQPSSKSRSDIAQHAYEFMRTFIRDHEHDTALWIDQRFFASFLNHLFNFGLAHEDEANGVVPDARLQVIHRRSAAAMSETLREQLNAQFAAA
ncbi:MAG: hypothetical protein F4W90_10540 [Gammaproteobacteria bacterium]|nr:hypothetical protein [Gammaproteobacteria bacterium]